MGGVKKGSLSKKDKTKSGTGKEAGDGKKGKKDDKKPFKSEITVMLTDEQVSKVVKGTKVITASDLATKTGVKISTANTYLKRSTEKGTLKKVGGYSGHYIYQFVESHQ